MLVSFALTVLSGGYSVRAYERLQGPTELLFCNKEKALSGYTLFGVGNRTFLLDLEGRVVHMWPVGTNPHLLDNGNILWEYINPVTRDGPVKLLGDVLPMANSAFRAYRYPVDHPAFKGRDLTPKGTITERAAQGIDVYRKRPPGDRPPGQGGGGRRGQGGGGRGGGGGQRGGGADNPGDRPPRDDQQEK